MKMRKKSADISGRKTREDSCFPVKPGRLRDCFLRCSTGFLWTCSSNCQRDTCGYAEAEEVQDVDNMWDALLEILEALKRSFNENQNLKSLGYDIVEYVKAHFTSSGLSQQDIADHFRVSRPTVSKVFKETMKVNFIDYLHKLRVEQAKIFFEQENYNVPAVAQLCGYENEITFKRAFVKNEGMTPREYVKTMDGRLRDPSICSMKSRRKAE